MAGQDTENGKPEAEKEGKKPRITKEGLRTLRKLMRYIRPYSGIYSVGFFFLICTSLTAMAFPYLAGELINLATHKSSWLFSSVDQAAVGLFIVLAMQAVFSFIRVVTFATVSERSVGDLRVDIFNRMVELPMAFFDKRRVGELTSRITADVGQIQNMMSTTLAELIRQIAVLIIGISLLVIISPSLTGLMLVVLPPVVIAAFIFGKLIRRLARKTQDELAAANTIAEESLQNISIVKAFVNEKHEAGRYRLGLLNVVKNAIRGATYRGTFISSVILFLFGAMVMVIWFAARDVYAGKMDEGDLFSFVMITVFVGGSVGGLGEVYGEVQKAIGASQRIREILEEETEHGSASDEHARMDIRGEIEYENVNFRYPTREDVQVLHDLNLSIREGEKIALAGSSGAGKSTIAQLLLRFYDVQSGAIKVDGKDIREYDIRAYRRNIGIVPQEVILFGGTIRENIAYGKKNASEEEIFAAARKANALHFIQSFPEGLDTLVGERGVKLSGGQRQRIAIARAILRDPRILILDEATSSLDAESEHLVQEALDRLMHGRTTIIIAHRLATIRNVDCIYVLDKGMIVEKGTHDQLIASASGVYHKLVRLQMAE